MSQLFASGGQNIGASAWMFPMNIQGCLPLGLTGFNTIIIINVVLLEGPFAP